MFPLVVPAIGVIAVIRFLLMREFSRFDIARAAIATLLPCTTFYASIRYGDAPVPPS